MQEGYLFSIPPLEIVICGLINDGHSDWCEVVSHGILICLTLIIRDVEYFFMCLLTIHISSWRNVYSGLWPIFPLGCWLFLLLSCISCLYILEIKPLSVLSFETIFSYSVNGFLVSFAVQKLVSLIRSHWFSFALISVALGD